MAERPSWWDGVTHDALYTPDNIGREVITTLCGRRTLVTALASFDPITCAECKAARLKERLRIARTGAPNLLSVRTS